MSVCVCCVKGKTHPLPARNSLLVLLALHSMHDSATAIHYTCSPCTAVTLVWARTPRLLFYLPPSLLSTILSFLFLHVSPVSTDFWSLEAFLFLASLPLAGWLELISGTHCLYLYLFIFNVKMHISKPLTSQLLSQFMAILGFAGPHCVCSLLLHFLYAWILNGGLSWNEKQHTLSEVKLKYLHISIDGPLDWLRLHIIYVTWIDC